MRIILLALTGMGNAGLKALRAAGMDIAAVMTDPIEGPGFPHYACEELTALCERENIPVWRGVNLEDPEEIRRIHASRPDALVVATSYKMVSPELVDRLDGRVISVHPSLLPRHRGPTPVPWTIECGDRETGLSYIQPTPQWDAGPIWRQVRTTVAADETAGALRCRLDQVLLPKSLPGVVADVVAGAIKPVEQTGPFEYESKYHLQVRDVCWERVDTAACLRRFRARTPYPGSFVEWRERRYRISRLRPVDNQSVQPPGTVQMVHPGRCLIRAADGYLEGDVQLEEVERGVESTCRAVSR